MRMSVTFSSDMFVMVTVLLQELCVHSSTPHLLSKHFNQNKTHFQIFLQVFKRKSEIFQTKYDLCL